MMEGLDSYLFLQINSLLHTKQRYYTLDLTSVTWEATGSC